MFRMIFALGISMMFLNVPVEWLSLGFEWTWMLLFEDVQQGVFYATLFCFWIIFCGEHLMVSILYLLFCVDVTRFQDICAIYIPSTTNHLGPKSEESALDLLVAGWTGGVWLIASAHI